VFFKDPNRSIVLSPPNIPPAEPKPYLVLTCSATAWQHPDLEVLLANLTASIACRLLDHLLPCVHGGGAVWLPHVLRYCGRQRPAELRCARCQLHPGSSFALCCTDAVTGPTSTQLLVRLLMSALLTPKKSTPFLPHPPIPPTSLMLALPLLPNARRPPPPHRRTTCTSWWAGWAWPLLFCAASRCCVTHGTTPHMSSNGVLALASHTLAMVQVDIIVQLYLPCLHSVWPSLMYNYYPIPVPSSGSRCCGISPPHSSPPLPLCSLDTLDNMLFPKV